MRVICIHGRKRECPENTAISNKMDAMSPQFQLTHFRAYEYHVHTPRLCLRGRTPAAQYLIRKFDCITKQLKQFPLIRSTFCRQLWREVETEPHQSRHLDPIESAWESSTPRYHRCITCSSICILANPIKTRDWALRQWIEHHLKYVSPILNIPYVNWAIIQSGCNNLA